ncbi:LysR family transcriptional regulator [Massilia dura]|uniref:LysR family transcriptional regulator n=1 Tax=Pseudoduganella dura TaxID=321982 RepID=A0A6I3XJZ6_9BURK|nr:LysR substrate-binding domain-containing protein [Pseudoduganella dura]MUI12938.1 LysR family transcriptional regulator [Pseudoduganella dura]GGX88419.1 LysR family transcriptional regulator [Pseudoduganella dura]
MPAPLPIKSLLVFDAAMRHGSFSLAAAELHVTPGAVGQQIQKLEAWLGCALFIRQVRQVRPTAEAVDYWAEIQPALVRILHASDGLRLRQGNEVWLSMPPTLAAKWFAPRMAGFLALHPGVSLHLGATAALADFERERIDLSIRHFDGNDPALHADLLCADEIRVYCSPAYARQHRLEKPDDLLRATLLHTTLHPHWLEWLRRFSTLSARQIDALPSQHFDQGLLAIEAARHGQGVVLGSAILTENEIRDGSLCEPFGLRLPMAKGYYVVHHRQAVLRPAAVALRDWLVGAAAQGRAER